MNLFNTITSSSKEDALKLHENVIGLERMCEAVALPLYSKIQQVPNFNFFAHEDSKLMVAVFATVDRVYT